MTEEDALTLLATDPARWWQLYVECLEAIFRDNRSFGDVAVTAVGDQQSPRTTGLILRFTHVRHPGCDLGAWRPPEDEANLRFEFPGQWEVPDGVAIVTYSNIVELLEARGMPAPWVLPNGDVWYTDAPPWWSSNCPPWGSDRPEGYPDGAAPPMAVEELEDPRVAPDAHDAALVCTDPSRWFVLHVACLVHHVSQVRGVSEVTVEVVGDGDSPLTSGVVVRLRSARHPGHALALWSPPWSPVDLLTNGIPGWYETASSAAAERADAVRGGLVYLDADSLEPGRTHWIDDREPPSDDGCTPSVR